jgi:hypothetical protein
MLVGAGVKERSIARLREHSWYTPTSYVQPPRATAKHGDRSLFAASHGRAAAVEPAATFICSKGTSMSDKKNDNPFVGIAGVIGGISAGIVAIIAVTSSSQLHIAVWLIGILAVMGLALGLLAYKREMRRDEKSSSSEPSSS